MQENFRLPIAEVIPQMTDIISSHDLKILHLLLLKRVFQNVFCFGSFESNLGYI